MKSIVAAILSICLLAATGPAYAVGLYYDFGDSLAGGNYNNITQAQDPIVDSVDEFGAATGIGLQVYDEFYQNFNPNGTTSPSGGASMFDLEATRDSLFGCTGDWYGQAEPTGGFILTGLDPALTYDFTFFASRMNVSDSRETQYDASGLNGGTTLLDPANNTSEVAIISGISPTAGGDIVIDVSPGPGNTNSLGFYYLGAMKMDIVPEPATFTLLLLGGVLLRRRR